MHIPDIYRLVEPALRVLDAERAHGLALAALRTGIARAFFLPSGNAPSLSVVVWGKTFPNPVSLAAGFDKNAEAFNAALEVGFGFVEVGGVTSRPQLGNPQPRVFRLGADRAVVNRMGFNNNDLPTVVSRLQNRVKAAGLVGVNLGKNKDSEDAAADYAVLAGGLAAYADFLVINVSSPNTPGLRALPSVASLPEIIRLARSARDKAIVTGPPPLLLKISPDLESSEVSDIAKIAMDE